MNTHPTHAARRRGVLLGALAFALGPIVPTTAAESAPSAATAAPVSAPAPKATGSIEGSVFNRANGMYLDKAKVSVEGTNLQVLTDDFGSYFINKVPAGAIRLKVEYVGQTTQFVAVQVAPGQRARADVGLTAPELQKSGAAAADKTNDRALRMNAFVVESQRFRNAQEIAANEERNSVTYKNVVSADAFGPNSRGNLAEFVKFLPGVDIGYGDPTASNYGNPADATTINVRGFGADNTAITIDGMPVAGMNISAVARTTQVDLLSLNNASRVELIKVATPDMPSNSVGGSVNLVTRSAFEYAKPSYSVDVHANFNSKDTKIFSKEPGPANKRTFHTPPSVSASVVIPFTRPFGVSVSTSWENSYTPTRQLQPSWDFTNTFSTPSGMISDIMHPVLKQLTAQDVPWAVTQRSLSLRTDWRPTPFQTISASIGGSSYDGVNSRRYLQYKLNTSSSAKVLSDWGPDHVTTQFIPSPAGLTEDVADLDRQGSNLNAYIRYNLSRGPWHFGSSASISHSNGKLGMNGNGHFSDMSFSPGSVNQLSATGIQNGAPEVIALTRSDGTPFDYSQLTNWASQANPASLSVRSGQVYSKSDERQYKADLTRDLDFLPFNSSLKIGASQQISRQVKAGPGINYQALLTSGNLPITQFIDDGYHRGVGFGFGNTQQWLDPYKLFAYFQSHPDQINYTDDTITATTNGPTVAATNWQNFASTNVDLTETKTAGYWQWEGHFFHNRVTLLAGQRRQYLAHKGFNVRTDTNDWKFLWKPDGSVYIDPATGKAVDFSTATSTLFTDPSVLARAQAANAGTEIGGPIPDAPVSPYSLAAYHLKYQALRPIYFKRQAPPPIPTVAASINLTPNLVFKPSWSRATTLPTIQNGNNGLVAQGANNFVILPNLTGTGNPVGSDGSQGTITVTNPDLRPTLSDHYEGTLDYYTKNGGMFEATYYFVRTKNQWITDTIYNTDPSYADIIQGMGLSTDEYANYRISTSDNSDAVSKNHGYELQFRQNLGLFLGSFGQHFNTFYTYSHKNAKPSSKPGVIALNNATNNTWTAGIRAQFGRVGAQVRGAYTNTQLSSSGTFTYQGVRYQYGSKTDPYVKLDTSFDYQINKIFTFALAANNLTNSKVIRRTIDAGGFLTYAQISSETDTGIILRASISARF